MEFKFEGNIEELRSGIEIMGVELGFQTSENGALIQIVKEPGDITVSLKGNQGLIRYAEKIHFFRALGLFIEAYKQNNEFEIVEQLQFTLNGAMFDVSRNAVLKLDSIKKLIRKMALMGLNAFMLYTEDTYAVATRPYFGYMRGRYSFEELKECDNYAYVFGIEIIPCIQTLAHLEQALKWEYANNIKDTSDILLAGNDATYTFIEELIKAACAPFRSKRIHIGMDEADKLGLGKYLDINGYTNRFDIMNMHLAKVCEITSKYGLKPMIWSDMYFRLAAKGRYYDLDSTIPEEVIQKIPKTIQLVYWDYYHKEEEFYEEYFRRHRRLGSEPVFAGGIWTWNGITINYSRAFQTSNAALEACKKENVKEVITTLWGDDGAETNMFTALLGLQLYAEHGYARELNMEKLQRRFKFCTGADYDAFMDMRYFDETPGTDTDNSYSSNPSKYMLWQDVLIGLFDKDVESVDLSEHYAKLEKKMHKYALENKEWDFIFNMTSRLASVLVSKCNIGIRLKSLYDSKEMESLKNIAFNELTELYKKVDQLRIAHREQWFTTYKPFGWEVIDIRYGGLLARLESSAARLKDYIEGKIDRIEELEEERLYFSEVARKEANSLASCNTYKRIVSASPI